MNRVIFIVIVALSFGSCDQELTTMEQLAHDISVIDKYLSDNNIVAQTDPSGIRYVVTTEGSGPKPILSNTIVVHYTGRLLDGTVFDITDRNQVPRSFRLSQLIEGWQIAFPLIPEGSTFDLYIPSGLGYGKNGNSVVPPNSILVFEDVALIQVK